MNTDKNGFTLIELSVVLIIIGLIIGGIVVGQSLIRNAQLQSVISDEDQYTQAILMFKTKYNYLPGDLPNATSYWGDEGDCSSPVYTPTPHQATCNGNGDGRIAEPWTDATYNYETFRAWQQLSNAGLIGGAYNGIDAPGGNFSVLGGINAPNSRLSGGIFGLYYATQPDSGTAASNNFWYVPYGHIIQFGAQIVDGSAYGAILTPAEALGLDSKIDDGLPTSGKVVSLLNTELMPNCNTSNTQSSAQYNAAAYNDIACSLVFVTGF